MTGASYHADGFAWGESLLSRIDPRVKIAGVAALLSVNLLTNSFLVPAIIILAMMVLMIAGRIPYRRQLFMIAFPVSFALTAMVSQTVFEGQSVVASLGPVDFHGDGFINGLFISMRIVAGGLIVVLLGVTTPLSRLCLALRWYRVPAAFIEVLQLTYRYLFDIYAEFARMRDAQRSRLGWSNRRNGFASSRMLGGALFMRVYERGLRSSEAMRCRGAGTLSAGTLPFPDRKDFAAGAILSVLVLLLCAITVIEAVP